MLVTTKEGKSPPTMCISKNGRGEEGVKGIPKGLAKYQQWTCTTTYMWGSCW